jgi:HEAT repeat protein
MDDYDWYVRLSAAEALGEIGPKAAVAIPHLRKLSRDPDVNVCHVAAEAIYDIGRPH